MAMTNRITNIWCVYTKVQFDWSICWWQVLCINNCVCFSLLTRRWGLLSYMYNSKRLCSRRTQSVRKIWWKKMLTPVPSEQVPYQEQLPAIVSWIMGTTGDDMDPFTMAKKRARTHFCCRNRVGSQWQSCVSPLFQRKKHNSADQERTNTKRKLRKEHKQWIKPCYCYILSNHTFILCEPATSCIFSLTNQILSYSSYCIQPPRRRGLSSSFVVSLT